jgi:hypothetical protein
MISNHVTMSEHRNGARRAMMLAEAMVAVALLTIVMGVVVSVLISLRQRDRRLRDGYERAEQTLRLAEAMRSDIHRATNVSLPTKNMLIIDFLGETQTRYELATDGCRRTVESEERSVASRDLFSIGPAVAWSLENGPSGRRPMMIVTLVRTGATDGRSSPATPLVVYAAMGAELPNGTSKSDR